MPTRPTTLAVVAGLAAAGALLVWSPAAAQVEFGDLYGSVSDGDGTPLPGVSVALAGPGAEQLQVSDEQGGFRFLRLHPGTYRLEATLDGFSPLEHQAIDIRAGRATTLVLRLPAGVEEAITVVAGTPLLDERKLAQGTIVSRDDLDRVPTAGDPWALVSQTPGVLVNQIDVGGSDNSQGALSAPGVPTAQNDWMIDGVQLTDVTVQGASFTFYDLEQFDQVELATGGNDISKATAGAAVNMVTRRGTNELRGSARYLLTDEDLFWFFEQSSPDVDPGDFPPEQGTDLETSQLERILNYGLEAGGPLVPDRLWLWGSYGRNEFAETQVGGFPFSNQTEQIAVKANGQLSEANSLLASWNDGEKEAANTFFGPGVSLEAAYWQQGPGATLARIEDSQLFGSSLLLTGSWSDVDARFSLISNGCRAAGSCQAAEEFLLDAEGVAQNSNHSGFAEQLSREWKLDGSYFLGAGRASHELRFGGRLRGVDTREPFHWPGGRDIAHYAFFGLPSFSAQRGEGPPVSLDYTSLWVQDTVTSGRWTVNAGLRYDLQRGRNPAFAVPANPAVPEFLPAVAFAGNDGGGFDWESVSPRLGVTFAAGQDRDTLLRASFARFPSALGSLDISRLNPVSAVYAYFSFTDANGNDMWDGPEEEFEFCCAFGYDPKNPTDLSTPNRTDPGLDPELTDEIVLAVEHAPWPDLAVGASLTWRRTSGVLEERAFLSDATGAERLARREDYVFFESVEVTQPDGRPYTVDYYSLDTERFELTGGSLLLNGDREVEYLGATLSLTKRLSDRWMVRAFVNYGRPEWDIPASFLAFDDPTDAALFDLRGADDDGDIFAQPAGQLLLQSTWSFNVNGMVQIAPERPWGFNVAGNVYGREGYPLPLWTLVFPPDVGFKTAQAVASADDFRYEDLYTVDLRLEKELRAWGHGALTLSADLFNALNAGTVLRRVDRLGVPSGGFVTETLSPRIWRLGVRVAWR